MKKWIALSLMFVLAFLAVTLFLVVTGHAAPPSHDLPGANVGTSLPSPQALPTDGSGVAAFTTCHGRKSRPLRDQWVSPNNPKGLFILRGGSSNGCTFSASTGTDLHPRPPQMALPYLWSSGGWW